MHVCNYVVVYVSRVIYGIFFADLDRLQKHEYGACDWNNNFEAKVQ